ncbi:Hypothetical protein PHPALM_2274, partial [Phytophthora palmivora]
AEAPGRSILDSCTPVSGRRWSARSSGAIAAVKRWGLSGQPWNTPTRNAIGAVVPSAAFPTVNAAKSCGTLPKALAKSYHTTWSSLRLRRAWSTSVAARKLCSPQPFIARNPFCASAWRSLASCQRTNLRDRIPVYSL